MAEAMLDYFQDCLMFRLKKFLEMAEAMLDYFKPNLGRIEIIGAAKRIERVYFNIRSSRFVIFSFHKTAIYLYHLQWRTQKLTERSPKTERS